MQKIYDFGLTIKEYSKNVKNNDFPEISKCPCCNDKMIKNGFYSRYVITSKKTYVIYIRRYRCKHCGVTLSILPSFLLPRFQRSLRDIFNCIYKYLSKREFTLYRRAVFFYVQRFKLNIPGVISFFRDKINTYLSFDKRKAIKLVEIIKDSPVPTFSKRFYNHFNTGFMAL